MMYLFGQMWVWIVGAFVLGLVLGALIVRVLGRGSAPAAPSSAPDSTPFTVDQFGGPPVPASGSGGRHQAPE
ncbi:hypothetical protein [Antrihabitans spumae]|uniref:SH3 domain-containing protein n=1 Tax=Antrihabitans spumae TaxID=3373370 RepID=A0ABW7K099_9NOCA